MTISSKSSNVLRSELALSIMKRMYNIYRGLLSLLLSDLLATCRSINIGAAIGNVTSSHSDLFYDVINLNNKIMIVVDLRNVDPTKVKVKVLSNINEVVIETDSMRKSIALPVNIGCSRPNVKYRNGILVIELEKE